MNSTVVYVVSRCLYGCARMLYSVVKSIGSYSMRSTGGERHRKHTQKAQNRRKRRGINDKRR